MSHSFAYFSDFSHLCSRLESMSSRKSLTQELAAFFDIYNVESIISCMYLIEGLLQPPYEPLVLGVSDALMLDVLTDLSGLEKAIIKKMFHELGDIGLVAEKIFFEQGHHVHDLTLVHLHKKLIECALIQGEQSQEKKRAYLVALLKQLNHQERKYAARLMAGTMRIGVSDATLIKALAAKFKLSKKEEESLVDAYRLQSDLGVITTALFEQGIVGIEKLNTPELHIPIQSALAERLEEAGVIVKKIGLPCIAQPKYDGLRIQAHIDVIHKKISFFSRNMLPMHNMFPELQEELYHLCMRDCIHNVILDGEIIGYDEKKREYRNFQDTVKRRRKHDIHEQSAQIPIRFVVFDCLYENNKSCMHLPYHERLMLVERLVEHMPNVVSVPSTQIHSEEELAAYYKKFVHNGYEGIIIKDYNAPYFPGKRNYAWIKWKRTQNTQASDSVDVVILGYFYGKGKRTERGIGALLTGIYNEECDCFQTIAKVGTGLDESTWVSLRHACDKVKSHDIPLRVVCKKTLYPDIWCSPELVVSVKADELTRSSEHTVDIDRHGHGLALRFPRLVAIRDDKNAYQTTTVKELGAIYHERGLPTEEQ